MTCINYFDGVEGTEGVERALQGLLLSVDTMRWAWSAACTAFLRPRGICWWMSMVLRASSYGDSLLLLTKALLRRISTDYCRQRNRRGSWILGEKVVMWLLLATRGVQWFWPRRCPLPATPLRRPSPRGWTPFEISPIYYLYYTSPQSPVTLICEQTYPPSVSSLHVLNNKMLLIEGSIGGVLP